MTTLVRTLLAPGSRFGVLRTSLGLMLFLPFVLPARVAIVASPVLFTVVLLSSLSAVADTRLHVTIGAALAIPGCALIIVSSAGGSVVLRLAADVVDSVFLGYATILILVILVARLVGLHTALELAKRQG
jgi:hypothetical protein